MDQGWIKLYRKTLENPVVMKNADHLALWVYLLMKATHKKRRINFDGEFIEMIPGQLVTGRKSVVKVLNLTESKVQRILKTFEIEQLIEQQTTPRGRLITILNWGEYQESEHQNEQQVNNKRTTSEQQVNTNKNERMKECKNHPLDGEGVVEFIRMWNHFSPKKIQCINKGTKRYSMLVERIKEHGEMTVVETMEKIKNMPYLMGEGDSGVPVSFDWFVNPDNFVKVMEDQYSTKANTSPRLSEDEFRAKYGRRL